MSKELWMLVREGHVQRLHGVTINGIFGAAWPVAENHADALKLAKMFSGQGITLRPAKVGSVEGETLENHIRLAIEDGCIAVLCVDGWDGVEPRWKSLMLSDQK